MHGANVERHYPTDVTQRCAGGSLGSGSVFVLVLVLLRVGVFLRVYVLEPVHVTIGVFMSTGVLVAVRMTPPGSCKGNESLISVPLQP